MSLKDDSKEQPYARDTRNDHRPDDGAGRPAHGAIRALDNSPEVICKLLRSIAGGTDTIARGHDTILIAAAEMIEAHERRAKRDNRHRDNCTPDRCYCGSQ